jgi:hypothetical protein
MVEANNLLVWVELVVAMFGEVPVESTLRWYEITSLDARDTVSRSPLNFELKETMTHHGGIKNLLELWKVTGKFKARSREDNAALETIYKNDLETAALVDTEYNIHPDRAKLINSELISLVKEIAKLNIGFEEFDLLQAEINNLFKGLTVLESTTLISSGS